MYSMTYEIPGDVQVEVNGLEVVVTGGGKENKRKFKAKHVEINKDDGTLTVFTKSPKKVDRADVGTVMGHIKNMVKGIEKGVEYKLKAVYSHFPMNAKVEGDKLTVENYLGEKNPRTLRILEGVNADVKGQDITLTGHNKEQVALCASQIEQLCVPRNCDKRVFQDGIYITEKNGKPVKK
jgi:large subunit ribosomal protein L6